MSADLFAQFGPFTGSKPPPNPQQGQPPAQTTSAQKQQQPEDPFAFLNAALSQHSSKPPFQQPQAQNIQPHTPQPWTAFGAPSQPLPPAVGWGDSAWGGSTTAGTVARPSVAADGDDEDDDTWGDFEEASPGAQGQAQTTSLPTTHSASRAPPPPSQPPTRTRVVRASTMDLMTNTLINFGDGPPGVNPLSSVSESSPKPVLHQPWRNPEPEPVPKPRKPADPNVLFDAEDYDANESLDEGDGEDEFGDFETGDTSLPQPSTAPHHLPSPPSVPSRQAAPPATVTALVDLLSLSDLEPAAATSAPLVAQTSPKLEYSVQTSSTRNRPATSLLSPLSFGSITTPSATTSLGHPQPPKSPSFQERNPFPGLAVTTPLSAEFPTEKVRNRTPSPVTDWPSFEASSSSAVAPKGEAPQPPEDEWDAWGATGSGASEQAAQSNKGGKPEPTTSEWDWEAEEPSQVSNTSDLPSAIANAAVPKTIPDNTPPPTNVPPPSILLSVFPTLIVLPDEALFKPTATQPTEVRNRILGDPRTIVFLRNYLQIIVVAGRVVAGRKQRWHRDKFLSQSMSISAAGSSKGGGMKLAGLDKAQGQREDREAADVVAAWVRHVSKLRSAVATANAALVAAEAAEHKHYPPLKIPELQSATIPVTSAKGVPTAPRPCVICGLRRDERVRGIDGDDVQDIFGEWWVEHWGHRVCRNFWAEHEATLRSR